MNNEFKKDKNLEEMIDLIEKDNTLLAGCDIEQLTIISDYLEAKKKHLEESVGDWYGICKQKRTCKACWFGKKFA